MTSTSNEDLHINPEHFGTKFILNGHLKQRKNDKTNIFAPDFKEKNKEQSKVCFLSGIERKILSGGHSRLECEYYREPRDIGPGSYRTEKITSALHQTLNKVTSTVGYGGLASRTPRFSEQRRDFYSTYAPTPFHKKCLIHVPKLRIGKTPPPFGSAVPRKTGEGGPKVDTPGEFNQAKLLEEEIKHSTLWNSAGKPSK